VKEPSLLGRPIRKWEPRGQMCSARGSRRAEEGAMEHSRRVRSTENREFGKNEELRKDFPKKGAI